jgi:hypothetical protein
MKEYECVQLNHHRDIGPEIARYQKNGWHLHTYQAAGIGSVSSSGVNHYLLFEREKTG